MKWDKELRGIVRDCFIGVIVGVLASWLIWGGPLFRVITWVNK